MVTESDARCATTVSYWDAQSGGSRSRVLEKKRQTMNLPRALNKARVVEISSMFLIFLSFFLNFVITIEHSLFTMEFALLNFIILIFSGCIGYFTPNLSYLAKCIVYSVLVTLFIDLQFEFLKWWAERVLLILILAFVALWLIRVHASIVLLVIFATINVATILVPLAPDAAGFLISSNDDGLSETVPPTVVHIILDEHIGLEGIPTDIEGGIKTRNALMAFYKEYGFRLYGGTYSKYYQTENSISNILNSPKSVPIESLYFKDNSFFSKHGRVLTSNLYFRKQKDAGYRIRVYQSRFMNFCDQEFVELIDCYTYSYNEIKSAALTSLSTLKKWNLIVGVFVNWHLETSWFFRQFGRLYDQVKMFFGEAGGTNAGSIKMEQSVSAIAEIAVFDRLMSDIRLDPKGSLYFAHFLLPHFSYIFDSLCNIRIPLFDWKTRFTNSSAESRTVLYSLYFEQIHCTMRRLRKLFDYMKAAGIFDDTTIIVHGDHGSRIVVTEPNAANKKNLSKEDLADGYSTLFAAKKPSLTTGYDAQMRPIEEIFQQVVNSSGSAGPPPEEHYVYLRNEEGIGWSQIRLPAFSRDIE